MERIFGAAAISGIILISAAVLEPISVFEIDTSISRIAGDGEGRTKGVAIFSPSLNLGKTALANFFAREKRLIALQTLTHLRQKGEKQSFDIGFAITTNCNRPIRQEFVI